MDDLDIATEVEFEGLELNNYDTVSLKSVIKTLIRSNLQLKARVSVLEAEKDILEDYANKQKEYIEKIHDCETEEYSKLQNRKEIRSFYDEFITKK